MERFSVDGNGCDNVGALEKPRNKRPRLTSTANVSAEGEGSKEEESYYGQEDMEGLDEEPDQSEGEEEGSYYADRDEEYHTDNEEYDEVSEEVDDINQGQNIGRGDTVSDDVSYGYDNVGALQKPRNKRPRTTGTTSTANVSAEQEESYYGEDMERPDEEPDQLEGEEEGSYDGERDEEYQTDEEYDEGSEEVDDINTGQNIGRGDTASSDVSYGNTAGSQGNKGSMIGTFSDQDVLDCSICCEALTIPVSQCKNGHIACASCCFRIGYKCPSCSQRIGDIRCRPIERIINSVKFECQNMEYGCKETMCYNKREAHGKACRFAPCSCPLESCDYVGSAKNLYTHFRAKHSSSASQFNYKDSLEFLLDIDEPKTVILQEKTDGRIFILNHVNGPFPHAINLICIGASHPTKEFYYELSVEYEHDVLTLKSDATTMKKWSGSQTLPKSLLVPFDFTYYGSIITGEICIEKRRRC